MRIPSSRSACLLLIVGLLLALAHPSCSGTGPGDPGPSGPARIVLVVIDTLRRDHVASGSAPAPTPHIDALARRGQLVEGAVASFHQTSSSMAALFTGRTPSLESGKGDASLEWTGRTWCGLRRFAGREGEAPCIPDAVPTLAEAVRAQGYWTAGVVSNFLLFRPAGFDRGFDAWVEVGRLSAGEERSAAAVHGAVSALLAERPVDRFFLYVHYMDVHDYMREERSYAESVTLADRAVGELVELLEREDLLEDAVLILTSDHGERLLGDPDAERVLRGGWSHHGNPSFEEVLRVPLIVVPPLFPQPPRHALRGDDVHRLIKRLSGIEAPGEGDLEPGELFVSELEYRTYRRGRWKSFHRRGGDLVLVDLSADPGEQRDVSAEHPEIAARHAARVDELGRRLAAPSAPPSGLTEEDRERLRILGYAE